MLSLFLAGQCGSTTDSSTNYSVSKVIMFMLCPFESQAFLIHPFRRKEQ